jgi:hypothetical protein
VDTLIEELNRQRHSVERIGELVADLRGRVPIAANRSLSTSWLCNLVFSEMSRMNAA